MNQSNEMNQRLLAAYLQIADNLVRHDEAEQALHLLTKGLPGYFRDNVPQAIVDMTLKIHQYLMSPDDYASCSEESNLCEEGRAAQMMTMTLRGQLLRKAVDDCNYKNIVPLVHEIGPADFWLPLGLTKAGCKFGYTFSGFKTKASDQFNELYPSIRHAHGNQYSIYVACEFIEHVNQAELLNMVMSIEGYNEIHFSTPKYCFDQIPLWDTPQYKGRGQHLRTYTPKEFQNLAQDLFPDYTWEYHDGPIMSLVGKLKKEHN